MLCCGVIFDQFFTRNLKKKKKTVDGSSGSERNNSEPEQRPKAVVSKKPTPSRPLPQSRPMNLASASVPPNVSSLCKK